MYRCGKGIDDTTHYPSVVDYELIWGDILKVSTITNSSFIPIADPALSKVPSYIKKSTRKKYRILYTPIGISGLYSVENWLSASTYDMKEHRNWVSDLFLYAEDFLVESNADLYIKIKGFDYELFDGYEYMLFPSFMFHKLKPQYLITKTSDFYTKHMDLHVFCGPSTTFAQSMAFNIPSICLWDVTTYQVKKEYEELYKELQHVGIIVSDSENFHSALKSRLYTDTWWSPAVQSARRRFCNNFASHSKDWSNILNNAFLANHGLT